MSNAQGRALVSVCAAGVLLLLLIVSTLIPDAGGAAVAALSPAGAFRVGSALGEERSGFSGRPQVKIFTSSEDPDLAAITDCLESAELEPLMAFFTGTLIDEGLEPEAEAGFRKRGLKVVVRSLNGQFLGGLRPGFGCGDLVHLLESVRSNRNLRTERSPIYKALLEAPAYKDWYRCSEHGHGRGGIGGLGGFESNDKAGIFQAIPKCLKAAVEDKVKCPGDEKTE